MSRYTGDPGPTDGEGQLLKVIMLGLLLVTLIVIMPCAMLRGVQERMYPVLVDQDLEWEPIYESLPGHEPLE